jgi:hypothetical protein
MALVREVDQEGDQKTDGGTVYIQILTSAKLKTRKAGKTIQLTGSTLRKRRSTLDCCAIYEEEEEDEEEEEEEEEGGGGGGGEKE